MANAYNFINSQTYDVAFSLFFEVGRAKSRERHSGVVKLSTGATVATSPVVLR